MKLPIVIMSRSRYDILIDNIKDYQDLYNNLNRRYNDLKVQARKNTSQLYYYKDKCKELEEKLARYDNGDSIEMDDKK